MKKKILSIILVVCLLLSVVPTSVFVYAAEAIEAASTENATESETVLEWSYELYGDGVCLTAYLGDDIDVYVPSAITVDGIDYNVIKLGDGLFENNESLNSATLGVGILEIGDRTFYDCDNLVCVLISEELTTIGAEAFYSCDVFNSIIIYDAVTSIGENAFAECPRLTIWCNEGTAGYTYATENGITYEILNPDAEPEIIVLEGVSYYVMNGEALVIGYDNSSSSVEIPTIVNGYPVTEIRAAFKGCYRLKKVILPQGLKTIGDSAFYDAALEELTIPSSVTKIGQKAFMFCNITSLVIPKNVQSIGYRAFYNNSLVSLTIDTPSLTITSANSNVFGNCTKLTEVNLPDGLKQIGYSMFAGCYSLTEIKIPDTVEYIDSCAFKDCSSLTTVILPSSLTEIGPDAFWGCTSLKDIVLPEGLTKIGSRAFLDCPQIKQIIIPQNVSYLINDSFLATTVLLVYENSYAHTYALENDLLYNIYDGTNGANFTTIDGVTYVVVNGEAVAIDYDDSLSELTIPEQVNNAPVTKLLETFMSSTNLTKITLPNSLKNISHYAFYNCVNLENITIPESVEKIGEYVFYNCDAFTEIIIPNSVTSIGMNAFQGCNNLTKATLSKNITEIDNYVFAGCGFEELVIPDHIETIDFYAFSGCKNLKSVTIPSSVTHIGPEAFSYCTLLSNVNLSEGLYSIYDSFIGCSSLEKVIIPKSVGKLKIDAFPTTTVLMVYENSNTHSSAEENDLLYFIYDGTNEPQIFTVDMIKYCVVNGKAVAIDCDEQITEITVPETVNGYPVVELRTTFSGCSNLTSVTLTDGLEIIGRSAFADCSALTDIIIPSSVITIGKHAFDHCVSLTEIVIPETVTSIGEDAFWYCKNLESIILPESLAYIGSNAFLWCHSLKNIVIPQSVQEIGGNAFAVCDSLASVTISEGVEIIGVNAFRDCDSLRTVVIPESITEMASNSFPSTTILMVYENSYAHTFAVENDLLYFVMRKINNPEISYGMGIAGTVTYIDGSVGADATVDILYDDGYVKESVIADENGAYDFTYAEVGRYTIRATDANGNTASSIVYVKRMNAFDVYVTGDTALTLKKGYSITGTVNKGGANITLTDTNGNVISQITADENGSFVIENIPNGEYIIKAECDTGTAVQEVTVFDGDVSDITITIETESSSDTATIWGYVEVEDREFNHHRRNWVEVKLYNEDGNVIDSCRSDSDGKYSFGNLPIGEYVVVAETAEMRPDKHHHYDRSHTLTGYAYISVEAAGEYQAETIVLYEENDHLATISGKVTAHGESQACTVTLTNIFRDEVATVTTGNNGKYSFSNVRDGMYFITAITDSNGMGYTVVVVRRGKVFGDTDITVYKADKIKDREDKFRDEIPTCNSKDDAKNYRGRIAEEKRFYDRLSHKEKKQLSREYVDRLNKLCEWISDCEYTANEGVTVEQGGLVMSGDELENENCVSFNITVEKTDAWEVNIDGVKDGNDFVHHNMRDKADDRVMQQYYEISMSKTVDGEEKAITSVYKDTDAMGKFRITMDIPEEYRGYKNYSLVHVHCGETVMLTDLDDNPDTITFEVDKFSTFVLTATDETLGEAVPSDDALKFDGASLTLTDSIAVNYKVNKANVADYTDLYVKFTFGGKEYIVSEYTEDGEYYVFTFDNIAPNRMNDKIYAALYGTKDGVNYESADTEYSVATYCYNMLAEYSSDDYAEFRTLLVDLLNFGAASQEYTNYNIENLANSALSDEQKEWGTAETRELSSVQNLKYKLAEDPTVSWKGGGLYLADSVTMRFTIQTESIENLTVKVKSGDKNWEITADSFRSIGDNKYYIYFNGLNATQMSQEVYLTIYDGETAVSNTICYSIESYACSKAGGSDTTLSELVTAMMKYGDAAAEYAKVQQ